LSTEVFGPLGIGITIGELADLIDDRGIGAPGLVGPGGTGHLPTGAGLGLPTDSDTDRLRLLGQGDVLDQTAQQLLALGRRGGLGPPEGREILGERQEAFALLGTDRAGGQLRACGVRALKALQGGELLVPLPLQATGDQAVLGLDGEAAAARARAICAGVRASRKAGATAASMPSPRMNWQVGAPR
jgi:hypothetical protein